MSDKYGDQAPETGNTGHGAGQDTDFGLIEIDERRVVAIREGLGTKDRGTGKGESEEPRMNTDGHGWEGGARQ